MGTLTYVYAVLAEGERRAELTGIDRAPVRLLSEGALAAAASDVPAEDFEEEPLNENIRDMEWLGERAAQHQAVNARLFRSASALLPLSFGTVFRSDDNVRSFLRENAALVGERLERVQDRSEWVITVERDLSLVTK